MNNWFVARRFSEVDDTARAALGLGDELARRLDRAELLIEALLHLVVSRKLVTREELEVLFQQVDLNDGVEDGRVSPGRRHDAPFCEACGRAVNPARAACVYCGAAIERPQAKPASRPPPPSRECTCGGCGAKVLERDTFFTDQGLRCLSCFHAQP